MYVMNMFWMQLFIIENFFFLDAVMQPIGKFVRKWCWIVTVYICGVYSLTEIVLIRMIKIELFVIK